MDTQKIQLELQNFIVKRFDLDPALFVDDPSFEEMNADSMARLEILLHADDTFGSHVLDYIEDGLLKQDPPTRLSELAQLIPQCMVPVKELKSMKKSVPAPGSGPHA